MDGSRSGKRFNVKIVKICGESGDVSGDIIESWLERFPELVDGYRKEDIWNMDETVVFWKALPHRGFGERSKMAKVAKRVNSELLWLFLQQLLAQKKKL